MGPNSLFVTGTDTGVGKTRVAVALVHALRWAGLRVGVMKPVAAGVLPECGSGSGVNEDAVALIEASGRDWDYHLVNPYLFREPVAPHLAAEDAGVDIRLDVIRQCHAEIAAASDVVVVEGAGGWLVPAGAMLSMADIAVHLATPVVLVVGMRLGCLNHALLTADAVRARDLPLAAWVANRIDPDMALADRNESALTHRLGSPLLGSIGYRPGGNPQEDAKCLDATMLAGLLGRQL